ncbi:flagellar protein FlaG [Cohnella panacarvi]|uniref:flagellar protein FlaG n=1 Tax=Cohnella panacarvi TaxID=400776 RepID=UPI00047B9F5F|nr:flagellar protein FlaG [Cohnella panacarvi]
MKIQSSPATNASHSSNTVSVNKSATESASPKPEGSNLDVGLVRNGKQLQTAELKGVKVSVGEEQLIRAIDRAIKALEGPSTTFEMKVHEQTKAVTVKVFNKDTGELIREIPPEKTLDLVAKMMEFAGILVDEKV